MKNQILASIAILALVVTPVFADAAVVLRSGETVNVASDQVVTGDFYAAGGTIANSGVIEGDLYAAAGSFTNNGVVSGDLAVIGGAANVHASVTDDVRMVGGEMIIAGPVGGDVVVFGGQLKILSTATVAGDVLFFGGDVQVLGPVNGSIMGTAEQVRVDAKIGGGVDVRSGRITLGDRAEVMGDVRYQSPQELVRSQNAVVVGEIVKNSAPVETRATGEEILLGFIVLLFSVLLTQLVLRRRLDAHIVGLTSGLGISGLIGLAAIILLPVLTVALMASMLGLIAGAIVLFVFITLVLLAIPFACIILGGLMVRYKEGAPAVRLPYTILAAVVIELMLFVPVVGQVALMVLFFISFGALLRTVYRFIAR